MEGRPAKGCGGLASQGEPRPVFSCRRWFSRGRGVTDLSIVFTEQVTNGSSKIHMQGTSLSYGACRGQVG